MTAVTISGSKARNVLARTEFDVYVSSWRAITDTIEVSLIKRMNSLHRDGSTFLIAWGMIMYQFA